MILETKGFTRYFPYFIIPFLFLFGIIGLINAFNDGDTFSEVIILAWMGGLIYATRRFLKMIVRIDFPKNSEVKIKTVHGKIYDLGPGDFISIKIKNGLVEFETRLGDFISLGNMDGFSEFVVTLKKANSDLVTKGC